MLYPTISEYISSIKDAENNFDKRVNLRPLINTNGEPIFTSGNFAVVFKMRDTRTNKYYAVKSFIKDQERRAESYKLISNELQNVTSPYLVNYEYLNKELFVDSSQSKETEYPVVVMDWIEGKALDVYVKELCESVDRSQLEILSVRFNQLATWLLEQPFAHGDLKHDNILVRQDGTLVLVDYDGMYVPAMEGQKARELGSPDYRHPKRTADSFNANIDLFPLITIALALKALSLKPDLYKKFNPKDHLLLTEKDFNDIANSVILKEISSLVYDKLLAGLYSAFLFSLHFPTEKNTIFDIFRISHDINTSLRDLSILKNIVSDRPKWFIEVISREYPLSEDLIEQYKDKWSWSGLSSNASLPWSLEFIEKYEGEWNWVNLSSNASLSWSLELIEKYKDKWNWGQWLKSGLSSNTSLPWSLELIELYKDKWDWCFELSSNTSLPWSLELIELYKDKWGWWALSFNEFLPWSLELIEQYKDKWNWEHLSCNASLPWSLGLIEQYKYEWNWVTLSKNISLPWSLEFIEEYKYKWDWVNLSRNASFPWSLELIELYKNKFRWAILSSDDFLPWSLEFIEKYKYEWYWVALSRNISLPWSLELIEKYKDKWQWGQWGESGLSRNASLPLSLELIDKYEDKWDFWGLSSNTSLSWSLELIEKYKDKWMWERLSGNASLPWSLELIEKYKDKLKWNCISDNPNIYKSVFKDLPSSTIDELMQTITNR